MITNFFFYYYHLSVLVRFLLLVLFLLCILCTKENSNSPHKKHLVKENITNEDNRSLSNSISLLNKELQLVLTKEFLPEYVSFENKLDSIAISLRSMKAKGLSCNSLVDSLIKILYSDMAITFDTNQNNIKSLLPHVVMKRKKGSCLGVSLLFLILAEKISCPLYGVLLPGHFFIRLQEESFTRNIEPNKSGYNHPDSYYFKKYYTTGNSWFGMRNLSKQEILAVVYFNIANSCRIYKKFEHAKRYYNRCLSILNDFPEAWGNLAIAYASLNQKDSALIAFEKAAIIKPDLENLALNKGTLEIELQNYTNALHSFKAGLSYYSDNPNLLYGIAYCYFTLGKYDSAQIHLEKIPDCHDSTSQKRRLLQLIKEKNTHEYHTN